jgi:hypothetical protein
MNWSRGFFRLWIAIACLWVGVAATILYQEWQRQDLYEVLQSIQPTTSPKEEVTLQVQAEPAESELDKLSTVVRPHYVEPNRYGRSVTQADRRAEDFERRRHLIEAYICAGLLPPLALLGAGMVIRWIARGFRG